MFSRIGPQGNTYSFFLPFFFPSIFRNDAKKNLPASCSRGIIVTIKTTWPIQYSGTGASVSPEFQSFVLFLFPRKNRAIFFFFCAIVTPTWMPFSTNWIVFFFFFSSLHPRALLENFCFHKNHPFSRTEYELINEDIISTKQEQKWELGIHDIWQGCYYNNPHEKENYNVSKLKGEEKT